MRRGAIQTVEWQLECAQKERKKYNTKLTGDTGPELSAFGD